MFFNSRPPANDDQETGIRYLPVVVAGVFLLGALLVYFLESTPGGATRLKEQKDQREQKEQPPPSQTGAPNPSPPTQQPGQGK